MRLKVLIFSLFLSGLAFSANLSPEEIMKSGRYVQISGTGGFGDPVVFMYDGKKAEYSGRWTVAITTYCRPGTVVSLWNSGMLGCFVK
tara:strand:+ start:279427 stop:279690 length:264 start_codon:yes stop_codon:yes gene_type:complete